MPKWTHEWDDKTDNVFTRDRKRLDQMLHEVETEFPIGTPATRVRMHPDKLARRMNFFAAVVDMLRPYNLPAAFCKNVWEAEKWQEKLHKAHFDYLLKLRRRINELNPTFPHAFALTDVGRNLSPDSLWAAIRDCTTRNRVEYVDAPKKGQPVTPVAQTVLTDVPVHSSLVFKRQDKRSRFQRAMWANIILEIGEYSLCLPCTHGMTIHHDKSCYDKDLMDKNILRLMGHKFDSESEERINRNLHQLQNMWRNGLFNSHRTSFTNTNHFLRLNPSELGQWRYIQDGTSYSEGTLTDRESDHEDEEEATSTTILDEQQRAFARLCERVSPELTNIAKVVNHCTKLAETRWKRLIDWEQPSSHMKVDTIGVKKYTRFEAIRHKYYSHLTTVLVKRLVRKQLLIYQGHTPSARHPLKLVGKELHPTSRFFFLLERQVGMTHKQIVKKLVHSVRTDMRHNQFGKEYSSDSEGDGPWQIPGLRNWDEDSGEVHLQGLDSGYSSNSMGDGPMWIPITMKLRDDIDLGASTEAICDINATRMNETFDRTIPPWSMLATWDGTGTAEALFLFMSYGYKCGKCGEHFIGDDSHTQEQIVACSYCAAVTVATRLWLVKADHPMVISALRTIDARTPTQPIRRKLEMSHLTPVKSSHLQNTDQCLTADSRLLYISTCKGCGELVQPANHMCPQKCLVCNTPLDIPSEYVINDDINYDAAVLEKYPVCTPSPIALIMAGMALSAKDRATQANNKYLQQFPYWPLTDLGQVKRAVCQGGLQISAGAYNRHTLKTSSTNFETKENLIGGTSPGSYCELKYLAAMSATNRTDRHKQQADFLRYLKEVGYQPVWIAMSRGECLLYSEKEENISALASREIRAVVQSLCALAEGWPTYRHTYLHREATQLSKDYANLIVIDAQVFLIIDTHLRRAIRKFMPTSFATRMNFVSQDFKADRLSAPGLMALMLSDDKSVDYMTATSDRAELDRALNKVRLTKDMSIEHFQITYRIALEEYDECSSIPKFPDTQRGVEEQVEHLLQLLGDGELKTTVASKFDKLRAAAELDGTERPGIDKFWEVLARFHAVLEQQKLRSVTTSNPNKRQRDEVIATLNIDEEKQSRVCFNFQKGKCTRGSKCIFAHTSAIEPTVKKVHFSIPEGKGKGKGKGKPVRAVDVPFKGSKGSKGLQGKGKGKGNDKGGKGKGTRETQLVHCTRCELSHHGATGKMCIMPPCRYCVSQQKWSTNHHLKDCRHRPSDWQFQPSNLSPAKRPQLNPKDNPSPAKHAKVTPSAWLATATVKDFQRMREMANAIGEEFETSKGTGGSSEPAEQITAVVKYSAPPKPTATAKAKETTHIVPIQATATVGTVTRTPNKTSHADLLKMARIKAGAQFGGRQRHESLILSDVIEDPQFSWNGLENVVTTIEINFVTDCEAAEPQQLGCSGPHATQKTSVKFLNFEDKSYVKPEVFGRVSTISMGFTDTLDMSYATENLSTATSDKLLCQPTTSSDKVDDEFSDCEWIALANCDHEQMFCDTGISFTMTAISCSRQLASAERYRAMSSVNMPSHNVMYTFDQYGPDHDRIITDEIPNMQERNEETLNSLQAITEDGFLADSGATSSINIINNDPRSKGKYGVFMLVSKIVKLEKASTFTIYGGGTCELRILGWAWHRFPMRCSLTQDVVVIVARAFVAVDTTGKYRRIYSPGSMVPFGFIFMHGTPKEVTISGTELTSTLHGPSTQAYIFDPIGHAIVCPPIGKGLVALSILDSTDPELVEIIQEATEHEVMLLVQIGANRGHNGVVDPDFFNPEEIQRDFHNSNSVLSIAVNIQRPLSSQTSSRRVFQRPIHVPVIDPMLSAEDLGVSTSKYGTELAKIMSKIERLHMAAAEDFLKHDEEFLKGGRLDAQTAHDKVQQVLTILQELGDGLGDDGEGHAQSLNQLQECAVQAGFGSNLPTHLQPEKLLGFPGILDPSSTEVAAFQHGREDPMHLPYLGVPTEEFHHRILSLNHNFCEYQHFESKENAELSFCEVNTSGSLQPLGQTHIWIGKPSVVFFNLLYSDRRAHIHVFTEAPVTEIYSLVNADMWCQFTVHRIQESNISTDQISAVLSQGLVSLKQVLTIHHECSEGGPSLLGLLSNLPSSTACLRTECNGGNFTVISAWPGFNPELIRYTFNHHTASENDIERLLAHYDSLRIAQIARLLDIAEDDSSDLNEFRFEQLQEVCHLLFPEIQSERRDDEEEDLNLLSTTKGMRKGSKSQTKRNSATAAAAPASNRDSSSGKRKLPVMPVALAQKLHDRFTHPGRNRLIAALRLFGWLDKYQLPLHIPCLACDLSKACKRPHRGKTRRAEYPGQIWHADLMSSGDVIGMDGSKYAAFFTDDASGKILTFPLLKKSQFAEVMRNFLARLLTLPETMVLDSGGENMSKQFLEICYSFCIHPVYSTKEMHTENLSERSIRTLRDTSMTMLASAAMNPCFWPWAIQYAAYIYDFIPRTDGKPPYLHWHDKLPPNLSFPVFGSRVVYRQKEPDLQHQYDLPGHTGVFLGVVPDQYAIWLLDTSISNLPIRRTSEEFQRTYIESAAIDVRDSKFSLDDYAKYGFQDTSDPKDPVDIREYLQTDFRLPVDQDIGMFAEAQRFIRRRGRFLRNRGDLSAWQIESLISREWRRKAAQRLNKEYDPIDRGTYLDSLLADYDSDTEETDETPSEAAPPSVTSTDSPMAEPLKKSTTAPKARPPLPPRGEDIASGTFLDTCCEICNGKHFNQSSNQMLLCDMCDQGFHRKCIGQTWMSPPDDCWCCSKCLGKEPNITIEIKRTTTSNRKQSKRTSFVTAKVLNINQTSKFSKVQVQFADEAGSRSVNLCNTRWRLPGTSEEGICYFNEQNEIVILKEPKSWKAIQKIEDPIIRQRWNDACDAEMRGIKEAHTYKLVDRPSGVRCIPLVWVFKIKQPLAGETIGKFKARCCLLGNIMLASDQDFASPTPRLSTFRYLLSYAAKTGAHVWSADVEQAFLSAAPAEPIYCTFPPGYEDPNGKVMFLLKNLYGSTTAPFQFNCFLSNSLLAQGFTPNEYDCCLFTKVVDNSLMMVLCYVDDSASVHISEKVIEDFYKYCESPAGGNFRFGHLERAISRFLGFDIQRDPKGFILTQIPLIEKIYSSAKKHMAFGTYEEKTTTPIAKDTKLNSSKPVDVQAMSASTRSYLLQFPYREILGGVGYVALGTRPDSSYSYKSHGRWSSNYDVEHCMSLLSFVRYLYQTKELPLIICGTVGPLIGKSDADWNGTGEAKSTGGWIVFDGAAPLSWAARSMTASARSTAEAEFMSIASLTVELVYLKRLIESIHDQHLPAVGLFPRIMDESDIALLGHTPILDDNAFEVLRAQEGVGLDLPPPIVIFTDSLSAKAVAEKLWISDRMRHIKYSMFFIKSYIASGDIKLAYIKGPDLCADIMTKPFGASTSAQGQQMEGFFKHRKEVLGHTHFRPISIGGGKRKLVPADSATLSKS